VYYYFTLHHSISPPKKAKAFHFHQTVVSTDDDTAKELFPLAIGEKNRN
jgi:hypothetical protein